MLRLLALAAHFRPLNPGPYDPAVVALLNAYFEPKGPASALSEPPGQATVQAFDPASAAA